MKINPISRRIKKAFTLIELTVVIATTSILLLGFTAFTIFFSNQYTYEMNIKDTENSAITLKYAISNNIDKFNYTYETARDFLVTNNDDDGALELFSTVTPIETENFINSNNAYSGAIIRYYKFYLQNGEAKPYFGYTEQVFTFNETKYLPTTEREIKIREFCDGLKPSTQEDFKVYEARSRMELSYEVLTQPAGSKLASNCKEYQFTIDYDFATDAESVSGTKKVIFNKYVYFIA